MAVNDGVIQLESSQSAQASSPVYNMLPNALQSGLQPLALVRRRLSGYGPKSRGRVTSLSMFRSDSQEALDTRDEMTVARSSPVDNAEISGICWKFARHGSHVLESSLTESKYPDAQSQVVSRQLYVDGVVYLIQGLPSDLTDHEEAKLKNAIPASLQVLKPPPEIAQPSKRDPSFLHRSLASVIVAVCLLLRLALPYIKFLITGVYSYDRAHHVSQRVFAFGVTAADRLGKGSVALASTAMTNEFILGAVSYWVDGIRGGLDEGLGEGLKVIDSDNKS